MTKSIIVKVTGSAPNYNSPSVISKTKEFFGDYIKFVEEGPYDILLVIKEAGLEKFAEAIREHEGWFSGSRSQRNKNPGNLKYQDQAGVIGNDSAGFAIFNTVNDGWNALIRELEGKFTGRTRTSLRPTSTIYDFFKVYAPSADNNNPKRYAEVVAGKLHISPQTSLQLLYWGGGWAEPRKDYYDPKTTWNIGLTFGRLVGPIGRVGDSFEQIAIGEILHILWLEVGLGDYHDKNYGQRDSVKVFEMFRSVYDLNPEQYFKIKKTKTMRNVQLVFDPYTEKGSTDRKVYRLNSETMERAHLNNPEYFEFTYGKEAWAGVGEISKEEFDFYREVGPAGFEQDFKSSWLQQIIKLFSKKS